MAITVKHTKVSTIPDAGDASLIEPSDWNADHQLVGTVPVANGGTGASTLTGYVVGNGTSAMTAATTIPNTDVTGLGTMSTQDASNINVTGGSISGVTVSGYIPTSAEGVANGVATLDSGGQIPLSQIPPLGDLNYQGTWNATTNTPTLTSSVGTKGYYYVVSVAGTTNLNGITDWQVGDWAVYNGTAWQKIDNTDAVTSVNGYTGTVVLTNTDISGFGTMSTQNANAVAITGGSINGTTIGASTQADITGNTISAYTKFVAQDYYAQSILGGNLRTSGGTSLLNWDGGGSGNVTVNGGLVVDPANKNINMSPTGTGSVTIAPATTGAINNMVIGATTPKAITGTTVTATTFSGSGASLTSIPNSALVNSSITINGNATALGGSVSVGTVTSVTGTSPVVSSGGTTPAISMPAATTSVSGYLTSTDWNTFNGKSNTNGTVTSVAALTLGTTGTDLSSTVANGTTTPVITLQVPTASATNRGALSSTDWSTFNGKQAALVSGTNIKTVAGVSLLGSGDVGLIGGTYGGTGVNNGASTITVGGNVNYSGAYTQTWTRTANTSLTLPVSGTVLSSVTAPATNPISGTPSSSNYLRGDGTWSAVSVSAAGSNTQIQYNNSGAFGASPSFTFDGTTNTSPVQAASNGFFVNPNTNTSSYTIPSGSNAVTAGKFTVATSTTITVSTGSRWVVI